MVSGIPDGFHQKRSPMRCGRLRRAYPAGPATGCRPIDKAPGATSQRIGEVLAGPRHGGGSADLVPDAVSPSVDAYQWGADTTASIAEGREHGGVNWPRRAARLLRRRRALGERGRRGTPGASRSLTTFRHLVVTPNHPTSRCGVAEPGNENAQPAWLGAESWWRRGGSNSRPSHCERDALPAELRPHGLPAGPLNSPQKTGAGVYDGSPRAGNPLVQAVSA